LPRVSWLVSPLRYTVYQIVKQSEWTGNVCDKNEKEYIHNRLRSQPVLHAKSVMMTFHCFRIKCSLFSHC
jgi:hypothetical protein